MFETCSRRPVLSKSARGVQIYMLFTRKKETLNKKVVGSYCNLALLRFQDHVERECETIKRSASEARGLVV